MSEPTKINFVNHNGQRVIDVTQLPATDSGLRIYLLRCGHCQNKYAVKASEVWEKRCPACQENSSSGSP
jgi:hypothetical protein